MELVCPLGSLDGKTFSAFIQEREASGRPVNLTGSAFPAGRSSYSFLFSVGEIFLDPDPLSVS
jgi:hypothetical protein